MSSVAKSAWVEDGDIRQSARPLATESVAQAPVLSSDEFCRQLQVEKRRSDRSGSPLSLVVCRPDADKGDGNVRVAELVDLLRRTKRETDVLGRLDEDRVAVLLPYTGEEGANGFARNLRKFLGFRPVSLVTGTYPDHLFDNLISSPSPPSESYALMIGDPSEAPQATFVKRILDLFGASAAIVVLSPVLLAVAVAVATTSPGPVVFRQVRVGKGGQPFVFYKFRSMEFGSDDQIHREYVARLISGDHESLNNGEKDKPHFKIKSDPRVTWVGAIIRRTSLDELPQLLNVLKGDMSLVGPRPPLPYEAEKYQSWHLRRVLEIRPGITGLWQVEGRSKTSFDEMVRLDLRYRRDWSLWLDLKILLKTVKVVLTGDGAG